jgi:hypothetical protein
MPTTCWPSIRGTVMRLTKLDACGAPVAGAASTLITDGFVSVQLSPQYEDGEETKKKNAAGKIRINDKADDELSGFEVEAQFLGVNPDLFNLMSGAPVVLDHEGNAVGNRFGATNVAASVGLEVWSDVPGAVCEDGLTQYGYFLLPFLHGGRLSDFTIEVSSADFTLTAKTKDGVGWAEGPYDVVLNPGVDPDPAVPGPLLVPLGAKDYLHMQVTTVAPPVVPEECGASALVIA